MPTATHATMHQDHRQWLSDNKMWRCDIAAWQQEFKTVTQELRQIETALKEHEQALQVHAAAIRLREQDLAAHEHALAEYERGEAGEQLIPLARAHDQEAAKHVQQHEAHERIKRHHHEVLAKVVELRKSLAKAAVACGRLGIDCDSRIAPAVDLDRTAMHALRPEWGGATFDLRSDPTGIVT